MQKRCRSLYYKDDRCKERNLMEKIGICLIFTARVSIEYDEQIELKDTEHNIMSCLKLLQC